MKINFDDEQEGENTENHMKIPNSDHIFKEQVKLDQLERLKKSIKSNKIQIIFIIIFCSLFTAYQLLQDNRISNFQKELLKLKEQINEMKSNSMKNEINNKNITNDNNNRKITNGETLETTTKKVINFSAETIILKNKFEKEIKYLQDCMMEIKIQKYDKIKNPKISIIIPIYKTETYINRFIKSIQKQELKELEIIFIED